MNQASPGGAGACGVTAAALAVTSDTEDENEMPHEANQDESLESASEENGNTWADIVSKAQRRRNRQAAVAPGLTQATLVNQDTSARQPRPVARKPAPRPAPLPIDDFKLVLRPQDGLNLSKILPSTLSLALLQATNKTWRQAKLRLQIDSSQNTATVSTPSAEVAQLLVKLKQVIISNASHAVILYGLAPDDAVKGVIRGVPVEFSNEEIIQNIDQEGFEIYSTRRLGIDSTTIILTFAGPKVPHYIRLYGAEHRCTLYKKTVPVCTRCHEVGHRSTACPQPHVTACHQCGTQNPAPNHPCVARCTLCSGPHLTGTRGCPKRYVTPFILRQRQSRREKSSNRISRRDQTPTRKDRSRSNTPRRQGQSRERPATPTRRGNTPGGRSGSRSRPPSQAGPQETVEKKVSWTGQESPTALESGTKFPTLVQGENDQCSECSQLKALIAKQNDTIRQLQARLEAVEQAQPQGAADRRKKAKRDKPTVHLTPNPIQNQERAMETQMTAPPAQQHDTRDQTNTSANMLQEAIHGMTQKLEALHHTMAEQMETLHQIIQADKATNNARFDALEANVNQMLFTQRAARRAAPYNKPNMDPKPSVTTLAPDGPAQ